MSQLQSKNISKYEMRLIAKIRGINVKESASKIELFRIFKKEDKITYKEFSFKSIVADIRNRLSKNGDKLIKQALCYVKEMKKIKESEVKNIKEKLIKFKNELISKNRINNKIKKDLDDCNGNTKYKGIKDIKCLSNEYEDEYDHIRYCLMKMKMQMKTK